MEDQLQQDNIRGVWTWRGLRTSSGHKKAESQSAGDRTSGQMTRTCSPSGTPPHCSSLSLTTNQVRTELREMKMRNAAVPNGIGSRLLKSCRDQLCGIMERVFNLSLVLGTVPQLWWASSMVLVPKTPASRWMTSSSTYNTELCLIWRSLGALWGSCSLISQVLSTPFKQHFWGTNWSLLEWTSTSHLHIGLPDQQTPVCEDVDTAVCSTPQYSLHLSIACYLLLADVFSTLAAVILQMSPLWD